MVECDEVWSYVGNKGNKQWIWLARYGGDRSHMTAEQLWNSLPGIYRQCDALSLSKGAVSYTDFWDAYSMILPSGRHRAVGKETGKTNHTSTSSVQVSNALIAIH